MDWDALAQRCHKNSRDHGFWDGERDFEEMMMLAASELAEAMEEHRRGRPLEYKDEHSVKCDVSLWWSELGEVTVDSDGTMYKDDAFGYRWEIDRAAIPPCSSVECKPEGIAVELADFVIRVLDTYWGLGGRDVAGQVAQVHLPEFGTDNFAACTFRVAGLLHVAADEYAMERAWQRWLALAVAEAKVLAEKVGCDDFEAVIERKAAYNNTRPYRHNVEVLTRTTDAHDPTN